jgi:peptidoglycan/xylan/chitin deacetylase (PgdA/CDA1 family)
MKISLTFDNGPDPAVTPGVLDVLKAEAAPATFFVVGKLVAQPGGVELMRRARDEGHAIGNHTYSHGKPFGLLGDDAAAIAEIDKAEAVLGELNPRRLFRPTVAGGALDHRAMTPATYDHLVAGGYSCVLWNNVPRDWAEVDTWPEIALAEAGRSDWSVMIIHDIPTGAMNHLGRFLKLAKNAGAEFSLEFPDACTPIRDGRAVWPMDHLMTH